MVITRVGSVISFLLGVVAVVTASSGVSIGLLNIDHLLTAGLCMIAGALLLYPWPVFRDHISLPNRLFHAGFCYAIGFYYILLAF